MGGITALLKDGSLFCDLGITDFNTMNDRAMLCRPSGRYTYIKRILADFDLRKGANLNFVHYVIENAFVK